MISPEGVSNPSQIHSDLKRNLKKLIFGILSIIIFSQIPNLYTQVLIFIDAQPIVGRQYTEKEIDYTLFRDFLKARDFQAANKEMMSTFHSSINKPSDEFLTTKDIESIPCRDLLTIDSFWNKYSNGKFGFRVQNEIWLTLGGKLGKYDPRIYELFSQEIGWKKGKKLIATDHANFGYTVGESKGHLPVITTAETTLPVYVEISMRFEHCKTYVQY